MRPSFIADGIRAEWDPATRIFDCRFESDASPPPARAAEISAWTSATSGGHPYGILLDGTHSQRLSTAFRATATKHLLKQRDLVRVACYGLDPAMHGIMVLITHITRANVRSFARREDALEWLAAREVTPYTWPTARP